MIELPGASLETSDIDPRSVHWRGCIHVDGYPMVVCVPSETPGDMIRVVATVPDEVLARHIAAVHNQWLHRTRALN